MRSFSDQLRLSIPAALALLLLVLAALPLHAMLPLAPHVVWLLTLTIAVVYPPAWPPLLAFALGLLSDVTMATPPGSQALLTLMLVLWLKRNHRRMQYQPLRVRWAEAAAVLLMLHLLLWLVAGWIQKAYAPPGSVLLAAAASALWYPVFYWLAQWLVKLLPGRN